MDTNGVSRKKGEGNIKTNPPAMNPKNIFFLHSSTHITRQQKTMDELHNENFGKQDKNRSIQEHQWRLVEDKKRTMQCFQRLMTIVY